MNEEGIKVSARPILVLTCFNFRSKSKLVSVRAELNFERRRKNVFTKYELGIYSRARPTIASLLVFEMFEFLMVN